MTNISDKLLELVRERRSTPMTTKPKNTGTEAEKIEKKYMIEVTEEQLRLIGNACELSSRLRSGQFHELQDVIWDFCQNQKIDNPPYEEIEYKIRLLKSLVGLEINQSIGVRESTEISKKLYEIYYMIAHQNAKSPSVYVYELSPITDTPKIKITECV